MRTPEALTPACGFGKTSRKFGDMSWRGAAARSMRVRVVRGCAGRRAAPDSCSVGVSDGADAGTGPAITASASSSATDAGEAVKLAGLTCAPIAAFFCTTRRAIATPAVGARAVRLSSSAVRTNASGGGHLAISLFAASRSPRLNAAPCCGGVSVTQGDGGADRCGAGLSSMLGTYKSLAPPAWLELGPARGSLVSDVPAGASSPSSGALKGAGGPSSDALADSLSSDALADRLSSDALPSLLGKSTAGRSLSRAALAAAHSGEDETSRSPSGPIHWLSRRLCDIESAGRWALGRRALFDCACGH